MKFYEKLLILIVLFLGVTIGTVGIIRTYVATKENVATKNENKNSIVLDDIFIS